MLHPSLLGGTEKENPWGIDPVLLGVCFAYDVLVHESIHVQVECVHGGWRGRPGGYTSHNNLLWLAEVNRIAPLLGLTGMDARPSKARRVAVSNGNGKAATKVVRGTDGNVPFAAVATFPYGVRQHQGDTDFYRRGTLPFSTELERM
jgi:hypothetical protein